MDWRGPKQIQVKVLILGEAIKIYEIDPHNRRICDFLDRIGFPDIMSIKVNGLVQDSFYSLQDNDHLLLRPSRNY